MNKYGISDTEYQIILMQIERRKKFRKEYLKLRTDPCMHSKEAGFVFDEAHQRYIAMQASQVERFAPNIKNITFGICSIVIPMVSYGLLIWTERTEREKKIRCGKLRYRDRIFKLC